MQPDIWKRFEFHWRWPSFLIGFALATRRREGWLNAPYAGIYSVACGTEPMPDGKYLVVPMAGEATP